MSKGISSMYCYGVIIDEDSQAMDVILGEDLDIHYYDALEKFCWGNGIELILVGNLEHTYPQAAIGRILYENFNWIYSEPEATATTISPEDKEKIDRVIDSLGIPELTPNYFNAICYG